MLTVPGEVYNVFKVACKNKETVNPWVSVVRTSMKT